MLSARELEFVLFEHPAVWDVAVVNQEDSEPAVFVQPRTGQKLDSDELALYCRTKFGEARAPKNLYVVDNMPKTKAGKISRLSLLEMIRKTPAFNY